MYSTGFFKSTAVLIAKIPAIAKGLTVGAAVFIGAAVAGLPVHDIWFDYVLFIIASGIVGGMPEPDTSLSGWRFLYTWAYRSGHLLVASGTAYFLHQNKWSTIRDGVEESGSNSISGRH
jgi:hypothetical protein